jgi:multicomponent Na+:H+ antiporter subunit D
MLLAMGGAAALCILIGVFPGPLYALLPYEVDYVPYTTTHVATTLQLLLWAVLAFAVLMRTGLYPAETPSVNLDFDWTYRRLLPALVGRITTGLKWVQGGVVRPATRSIERFLDGVYRHHGPQGIFAKTWPTGSTVLWVATLLAAILIVYYVQ